MKHRYSFFLLFGALALGPACADETPTLGVVTVGASADNLAGIADAASEGRVTGAQLAHRPLLRPAEVMETVPGMIVTQHSGDGKANQYFLRGFNLDHGSDFATQVMGMPINMVSHAHGQGYMDLNFLMPELVADVRYRKGVYAAEDGDFATAGSARIDYRRRFEQPFAAIEAGGRGYRRLLAGGGGERDGLALLGAVEFGANDGPWDQPENLRKTNAVLRLSSGTEANGYALAAMAYQAQWTATEHVPQRAIDRGEISRFGALLPNDGGVTHRYSLSGEWAATNASGATRANAYVVDYGLNLFSAPSGFIGGAQGDQHEQADARRVWGGGLRRTWPLGAADDSELTVGAGLRRDDIGRVGLYNTVNRQRTDTVREDRIDETAISLYAEWRRSWADWLRTSAGLRRDELRARATPTGGARNMTNGGGVAAGQTSPKLGVVFGPFEALGAAELFANWGRGFHSNDARGATSMINPKDGGAVQRVPLIVAARGGEIGVRVAPLPGWNTTVSLWRMELDSELVFVGDEGVTEPRGGTRRRGLEWTNHIAVGRGLFLDADLALSEARFKQPSNGGTDVPNAIPVIASLALIADPDGPWFGGLRLRHLGAYALEETGARKSSAFWMANLKLGYRIDRRTQATLDVLNLFDRKANDIEYWGGACTRLDGAGCNGGNGIDGRLVHPLEPRALRFGLRFAF